MARRRARRRAERRPLVAAAWSVLLPGAGHLTVGARVRGALLLAGTLALTAWAAWLVTARRGLVLDLLLDPAAWPGLLGLNLAVLLVRTAVVLDAHRLGCSAARRARAATAPVPGRAGRRPVRQRRLPALALLLAVTASVHVAAGYWQLRAAEVLDTVFVAGTSATPDADPAPAADLAEPAPPEPTPPPTGTAPAGPGPADPDRADADPADRDQPATTAPDAAAGRAGAGLDTPVTVLLVGSDAGAGRRGARTDTLILAHLDPARQRASLIGIPRNLGGVPLDPDDLDHRFAGPVNALYQRAGAVPGEPWHVIDEAAGTAALRQAVAALTGLAVDHTVVVDMLGFVDAVDALGGVEVAVREPVRDRVSSPDDPGARIDIDLAPGRHLLSGREALAYVRSRRGTDDHERMRRQRCLLVDVAESAAPVRVLRALPRLLDAGEAHLRTDLPRALVSDLVLAVAGVEDVAAVGLGPHEHTAGVDAAGYPRADLDAIRATVRAVLDRPPAEPGQAGSDCS